MPVTTRSQSRSQKMKETNTDLINKVVVNPDETSYFKRKDSFIAKVKKALAENESAVGKQNKMLACVNVIKYCNNELSYLIEKSKIYDKNCWDKFSTAVYNKCILFEKEYIEENGWPEISREVVRNFMGEYQFAKKLVIDHIKSININKTKNEDHKQSVIAAKKAIETAEKGRYRRRNIPVVDYTGMDTIEPESEYDGITDIWYDDSYSYDSDYKPEDEEEEKEEVKEEEKNEAVNAIQPQPKKIIKKIIKKPICENTFDDNSDSDSDSDIDYEDYEYKEKINIALAKTFEAIKRAREENQQKNAMPKKIIKKAI